MRAYSHKFIVNCYSTSSDSAIAVSRSRSVVKARAQCCISNEETKRAQNLNFIQPIWGFLFEGVRALRFSQVCDSIEGERDSIFFMLFLYCNFLRLSVSFFVLFLWLRKTFLQFGN